MWSANGCLSCRLEDRFSRILPDFREIQKKLESMLGILQKKVIGLKFRLVSKKALVLCLKFIGINSIPGNNPRLSASLICRGTLRSTKRTARTQGCTAGAVCSAQGGAQALVSVPSGLWINGNSCLTIQICQTYKVVLYKVVFTKLADISLWLTFGQHLEKKSSRRKIHP